MDGVRKKKGKGGKEALWPLEKPTKKRGDPGDIRPSGPGEGEEKKGAACFYSAMEMVDKKEGSKKRPRGTALRSRRGERPTTARFFAADQKKRKKRPVVRGGVA